MENYTWVEVQQRWQFNLLLRVHSVIFDGDCRAQPTFGSWSAYTKPRTPSEVIFLVWSLTRCRGQLTGGNGWITMRPSQSPLQCPSAPISTVHGPPLLLSFHVPHLRQFYSKLPAQLATAFQTRRCVSLIKGAWPVLQDIDVGWRLNVKP